MEPLTVVTTAVSSVKAAIEIAKFLRDTGDTLEAAEITTKISTLLSNLADAQLELAEFKSILAERDSQILELRKLADFKQSLVYKAPFYHSVNGTDVDGPFCQSCWDGNQTISRLIQDLNFLNDWDCKVCDSNYSTKAS